MEPVANAEFFTYVTEVLAQGEPVTIRVKGHSMEPLLRNEQDTVTLAPYGTASPQKGDVVLFVYRGVHILHRIVRVEPSRFVMQGDGILRQREEADAAHILGKVILVTKASGRSIDTDGRWWRTTSALWRLLKPVRRYLLFLDRHLWKR